MATFTAEEVFSTAPSVKTALGVEDVEVGGMVPGDEVYLPEQIPHIVPPVASFDLDGGDNVVDVEELTITGYTNNAFSGSDGVISIITEQGGDPVVEYSTVNDTFRLVFFTSNGGTSYRDVFPATEGTRAAFIAGDAQFEMEVDRAGAPENASSTVTYLIKVNGIETSGSGVGFAPRYSAVISTSFDSIQVVTRLGAEFGNGASNLPHYDGTDPGPLGRKMYYDGEGLTDISAPSAIRYGEADTKVYHNQTVIVDPLTEDITLDVDDLATHFRVLYLEDTEVTNTMSLAFPDDTFILGNAGDDITFTKLKDDSWFYTNERNNEKGIF